MSVLRTVLWCHMLKYLQIISVLLQLLFSFCCCVIYIFEKSYLSLVADICLVALTVFLLHVLMWTC